MLLPRLCIFHTLLVSIQDYIILHELLHTRIKDHKKGYWAELDRLTGDANGFHRELKEKYTFYN